MTPRRRWIVGAVVVLAALVAAPWLLRQVPFFRVRQVELVGVRHLDPQLVIEQLGLAPDQNLFDPLGAARERLARVVGIVDVTLDRRLPGTLRVLVIERRPAALVSGRDGMIALDCTARPLPYDPAAAALDLPLVRRPDTAVVGALCVIRTADSTLYHEVETARREPDGTMTLELGRQRVRLGGMPTTDEIRAVGAVRRHLAAGRQAAAELDARFAGWVIARRTGT